MFSELISIFTLVNCRTTNATTPAVLILNSWTEKNVPVISDYNGNVRYPTINAPPELLLHSCAIHLHGELYVFGGTGDAIRQVRARRIECPENCC